MQKFLKRFFACLTSLLVLTSFLALQAGADSSTLGTQSPAITAEYFTDAELTNQVDGNALTSGESYYMVLSVSDLSSVSQFQFTASYDPAVLQFGTVTVLPDIATGFDAITPVAAAGRFIFGFVSTESEYTALTDDSAVLAIAPITNISESVIDVEDYITVNTNPNYTFIEVSYADISYDGAGNRVYSCYGLATAEDFTGTVYTTMTCDLSPEVNFGYTVSAFVGYLASKTAEEGTLPSKTMLQDVVVTMEINGETVTAAYDNSTGQFVFENVPDGTYTATVTYTYGLTRTFTIVVDGADVISDTVIGIHATNFYYENPSTHKADTSINVTDLGIMKPILGKTKKRNAAIYAEYIYLDLNGDESINITDFGIAKAAVGITARNVAQYTPDQTVQNAAD